MREKNSDLEASGLKTTAGRIAAALAGLLVAAGYLVVLVYLLSGKVVVDADVIIFCFLVCGVAAGIGLIFVYRLLPRREPATLFGGSCGMIVQDATQTELPVQRAECPPESIKSASRVRNEAEITPVMKSHGSESIATYNTHDNNGAIALITAIGVSLVLGGRIHGGWEFLSLVVPAGGMVALMLYRYRRWKPESGISRYMVPVSGGVIASICMIGLGTVMTRFPFLRDFLGLAIAGGGGVALLLAWRRAHDASRAHFI